jgi:hypothetical protein
MLRSRTGKSHAFDGIVERALAAFDQKTGAERQMFVLAVIVWCLLFVIAWPIAVVLVFLLPLLWLLSIPVPDLRSAARAVLAFIKALLYLAGATARTSRLRSSA